MLSFERLRTVAAVLALAASALTSSAIMAIGVSPAPAGADQCLPPPQLLLSEVARVAGTASRLWGDLQAVQETDAAQGASGPGQVVQDLLNAANKDGYRWDCAGIELIPPPDAPARIDLPPETTTVAPSGPTTAGPAPSVPGVSVLAAPAPGRSSGNEGSTIALVALAAGSALLVILVVRRQMARR